MNDTAQAASTRTRAEKTKRIFISADGTKTPRVGLESVGAELHFVGSDEVFTFNYDDLSPEIKRAAALFGIMTSVTNTVGRSDMGLDEMVEAVADRLASIVEEGKWSEGRTSGPRTSDLIEAAKRWYAEKRKTWTAEVEAAMQARLADEESGEEYRKTLQKHVAVHFAAIKAERAAERAAKAKPSGNEPDDLI